MNMKLFARFLVPSVLLNAVAACIYGMAFWIGGVGVEASAAVFLIITLTAIAYRDAAKRIAV